MEYSPKKNFPVDPKDYTLYEEVGQGVSATVYRALCIPLNIIVAIKVLDLEKCNNDLDVIRREVQTMILLDHPNLLKAHCSFTDSRSLWIVTPYMATGSSIAYLHAHGHIHRDVKAGNILVDTKGAVKLADFGVSASLFETGNRQHARKTFVGTPCWMAPEVMQQLHGYDFKADIWSFGITALELAHGHAPFSKYPPMKVLLMTLQNAPPGLDYERDKRFSKSFKEIVAACLVKDPKKRPTAEKLLKHRFFKHAHNKEFIARTILDGLSPLGDRFRMLKQKEAEFFAQNEAMYGDKDHLSQQEYMRGISAWNFDLEDLKRQAALIEDDGITIAENQDWSCKHRGEFGNSADISINARVDSFNFSRSEWKHSGPNEIEEIVDLSPSVQGKQSSYSGLDNLGKSRHLLRNVNSEDPKFLSSLPLLKVDHSPSVSADEGSDHLTCHQKRYDGSSLHETAYKGRFKVTVPKSGPKVAPNGITIPYFGESANSVVGTSASILPSLHCILQQNAMQREETMRLVEVVDQITGNHTELAESVTNNKHMQMSLASARERVLEYHVVGIQNKIDKLVEELRIQKMKNAKLEGQLSAVVDKE
ncbi:serine/threonine-protein kinase fray2-like isoform X2 [Prunus yedoensis var. nudiflora]|uniref:Serine/threonine-protein kinase fray2-like isoform X2 n=1 Tax=Prunus yedoensis var. nudiflora TaxID=2094558 RepID=A0A314UW27_PRUYE|nr:serine/threonine-protein kinase fray2-like isoform X2 [Prunus yedoensis var. nudiflora]